MKFNVETFVYLTVLSVMVGITTWGVHWRDAAQEAQKYAAEAKAAQEICSSSIKELRAESDARAAESARALASARAEADKYALRADRLLRAPAAVPGDDCASAKLRAADWLKSRGQ